MTHDPIRHPLTADAIGPITLTFTLQRHRTWHRMDINTAIESIRELAVELENQEPGADHEREGFEETLANVVSSMKALLAQRKVPIGSVQEASSHPL